MKPQAANPHEQQPHALAARQFAAECGRRVLKVEHFEGVSRVHFKPRKGETAVSVKIDGFKNRSASRVPVTVLRADVEHKQNPAFTSIITITQAPRQLPTIEKNHFHGAAILSDRETWPIPRAQLDRYYRLVELAHRIAEKHQPATAPRKHG